MAMGDVIPTEKNTLIDNGGRRLGGDRRCFFYSNHLPERRLGGERRSDRDRRQNPRFAAASL